MEMIIENIKRIRKQKGYSHEYIAHELDISQVAYSKLEKNDTKLTVERLYKLAEILETPVTELLDVKANNIFHQNNNDKGTFIGNQEVENLYQENKEQNQKIIELYEARLQDKDRLIARLEALVK
ncbi:MAG: helix-turn-helix domain-containing protein [Winogradskyella sp.]|uniref:helix-turn-helix domain-containing protein n=1 Tax=Winogradskyella sp. TaxID=1883156 RepID=UPI0017FABCF0|nr:helix-turn-helix transcriptional regulator [Winogradskyella sp.]MBT8245774.1 helix-turn-helix transcriptional regulator [Winogradskyella sp.]NNK23344.1 helix-turn-helix domain-containing protein [Winogradskyella sp.]